MRCYSKHIARNAGKSIPLSQRLAVPAEKVADVVERALTVRSPRARYPVGVGPADSNGVVTNLPTVIRDRLIGRLTGI